MLFLESHKLTWPDRDIGAEPFDAKPDLWIDMKGQLIDFLKD